MNSELAQVAAGHQAREHAHGAICVQVMRTGVRLVQYVVLVVVAVAVAYCPMTLVPVDTAVLPRLRVEVAVTTMGTTALLLLVAAVRNVRIRRARRDGAARHGHNVSRGRAVPSLPRRIAAGATSR